MTTDITTDMSTDSKNLVSRDDSEGVTTLTLERADAYNALSDELIDALTRSFETLAKDLTSKVVVLRGAGRGFCAGHDLKQLTQDNDPSRQQQTFTRCSNLMQTITGSQYRFVLLHTDGGSKPHGISETRNGDAITRRDDQCATGLRDRIGQQSRNGRTT